MALDITKRNAGFTAFIVNIYTIKISDSKKSGARVTFLRREVGLAEGQECTSAMRISISIFAWSAAVPSVPSSLESHKVELNVFPAHPFD